MQWHSLSDFLSMGGYAGYVWGSFGVTAAALLIESVLLVHRRREAVRGLRKQALIDGQQVGRGEGT